MIKSLLALLSPMSPAHITLFTRLKGRRIGQDVLGNVYYESLKPRPGYKHFRRWVVYKGTVAADRVPPEWHGWLHHQTDRVPEAAPSPYRKDWQLPHEGNMTGTDAAYRPPGHLLKGGVRDKASGDYQAWTPPQ